jgi:hypothetical protein
VKAVVDAPTSKSDVHHKTEMEVLMDHPGVNDTTQRQGTLEEPKEALSALNALTDSAEAKK